MSGKHKNKPVRSCRECIHEFACNMQNGHPMSADSADNCMCYETVRDSAPYLVGLMEGKRTAPPRTHCSHGEGVTVRPDGVHELSPHAYKLTQKLRNVTVEVLTCETCGDVSVAWYRQDDTEEVDE